MPLYRCLARNSSGGSNGCFTPGSGFAAAATAAAASRTLITGDQSEKLERTFLVQPLLVFFFLLLREPSKHSDRQVPVLSKLGKRYLIGRCEPALGQDYRKLHCYPGKEYALAPPARF